MTYCNAVREVLLYASDTGNDRHGFSSNPQPLPCIFPHKHFGDQVVCFKNISCCVYLLLPVAGHFPHSFPKQHTRQVVEGCLAYESKQAAAKQLLARGANCIACREPPLWLHACPVSMPHIARRLLTPSAAWALLLLLQPPYPSQSSRPASKTEASRSCRYKVMSCVCVCVLLPVVAAEMKKSLCECTPCLNVIGV